MPSRSDFSLLICEGISALSNDLIPSLYFYDHIEGFIDVWVEFYRTSFIYIFPQYDKRAGKGDYNVDIAYKKKEKGLTST